MSPTTVTYRRVGVRLQGEWLDTHSSRRMCLMGVRVCAFVCACASERGRMPGAHVYH